MSSVALEVKKSQRQIDLDLPEVTKYRIRSRLKCDYTGVRIWLQWMPLISGKTD